MIDSKDYSTKLSNHLLYILVFLSTIDWIGPVSPRRLRSIKIIAIILGMCFMTLPLIRNKKISFPISFSFLLPICLLFLYLLTNGPETPILYLSFFAILFTYIEHSDKKAIFNRIIFLFSMSVLIQSVYALLTTFSPVPHIQTDYVRLIGDAPVSLYALQSGASSTITLAIGLIFSMYLLYINYGKKKLTALFWLFSGVAILIHILVFILLAGSGRAGILLLLASLLFSVITMLNYKKLVPLLMISPILFWILLYGIYAIFPQTIPSNNLFWRLNRFFTNRPLLYIGSLELVVENALIINGPDGIGLENFSKLLPTSEYYPSTIPNQTHNIMFNRLVNKGVIIGGMFLLWFWKIAQTLVYTTSSSTRSEGFLISVLSISYLFVGMSVGSASIFSLSNSAIWWILIAYGLVFNYDQN